MTANQINYAKLQEDIRTHRATEEINRRQATAAESQAESAMANAVTNRINAETNKANSLINESAVGAQWYGAQANAAYQQAMAAVQQAQQIESVRHNKTSETNDLIKSGRETTAKNYATQVSKENAQLAAETQVKTALISAGERGLEFLGNLGIKLGSLLIGG